MKKLFILLFAIVGMYAFGQQYKDNLNIGADIIAFQENGYVVVNYGGLVITFYHDNNNIYLSDSNDFIMINSSNDFIIPFTFGGVAHTLTRVSPSYSSPAPSYSHPITCYTCHGTGRCVVCRGVGSNSMYGQTSDCSACSTTGKCWHCHGSGDQ